jgi:hypothetical protein
VPKVTPETRAILESRETKEILVRLELKEIPETKAILARQEPKVIPETKVTPERESRATQVPIVQ